MNGRYGNLSPEKALLWRITHRDNLPWILEHGLHCPNSTTQDPNFVSIGNPDLIARRAQKKVPAKPCGMLTDYVPFYFTPFSVMMYNIHTGHGVRQRGNAEIVILVSSLHKVAELGIDFVFTDRHAYASMASFYTDLDELNQIDWNSIQSRDFAADPERPDKMERYQAEALVHRHLPVDGLVGIMCYNDVERQSVENEIEARRLGLPVHARPEWYFR